MTEQQILLSSPWWFIRCLCAGIAFLGAPVGAGVLLAFMVGLAGACAQPSFDAMTQRYIPPANQGRAFARFATRQQLIWVVGSIIPVVVHFRLPQGNAVMAAIAGLGGLSYLDWAPGPAWAQARRRLAEGWTQG